MKKPSGQTAAPPPVPNGPLPPNGAAPDSEAPFWQKKPLEALNEKEWESLCDGCGRCCLVKLEDEDNGDIYFTDIACRLFETTTCSCTHYAKRHRKVADCIKLTPKAVRGLKWLPPTCAYRLISEGRDLYWWHPLVSGTRETVHEAKISVRGRVSNLEDDIEVDDYPSRIVSWPSENQESENQESAHPKSETPEAKKPDKS
jgi:uncharacterized cysteine cluster protein YcgN (CxxCxxCC family)